MPEYAFWIWQGSQMWALHNILNMPDYALKDLSLSAFEK